MAPNVSSSVKQSSTKAPDERVKRGPRITAERAECTCPEFCERDHDID
jgi:hypothetical protein